MAAHDPDQVVHNLQRYARACDTDFIALLEQSLQKAKARADDALDPLLIKALRWPQTFDEYTDYVADFMRWIPCQSDDEIWRELSERDQYEQEVYDRLCHFFWLIDQDVGDSQQKIAENIEWFRDWLLEVARDWGVFLDSPESFSDEILDQFVRNAPQYRVAESLINGRPNQPSGWLSFNQFFARELNTGLRPIASPGDNRVVASAADCAYQQQFTIDADSSIPGCRVKRTHQYGNVAELLGHGPSADAFAGGTFVHYALPPSAYHRFHLPVGGRVAEAYTVSGKAYLQVSLGNGGFESHDDATTGYEFSQTRGVVIIDTADSPDGDIGLVAAVPVGMSHVGSINLTATIDRPAAKGAEFGYFLFGGSDMILLFQAGAAPDIDPDTGFRFYGSEIARCR
ncbi:phosphatidylserine decarboxylase [Salinisphaera japonica]|uniref:Phosphatidylserine decarboxylase n=1 Tax=Salinisphaera japonica YTM-1 TaxID=1209778 RepID=A0A423PH01_9GAMM|nr:phosphatidylserine decarboxylase [Salinisphaera japonica]ROO24870.1 phosphatidylserine decarboxylase [Salinisphaera japonica YTM-1]